MPAAEFNHPGTVFQGPFFQNIGKIGIFVDHRRTARLQSLENFRFGFGNSLKIFKKLNMHRINIRHQRQVRLNIRCQARNFAFGTHPHFYHRIVGVHIHFAQTHRHPDMVVVVAGGGIYAAETGKRKFDFLLGGGFAGAAGQPDHRSLEFGTVICPDPAVSLKRIPHHHLPVGRYAGHQFFHQSQLGSFVQSLADKIMTVKPFAPHGNKQGPFARLPAVGSHPVDFRFYDLRTGFNRGDQFFRRYFLHFSPTSKDDNSVVKYNRQK